MEKMTKKELLVEIGRMQGIIDNQRKELEEKREPRVVPAETLKRVFESIDIIHQQLGNVGAIYGKLANVGVNNGSIDVVAKLLEITDWQTRTSLEIGRVYARVSQMSDFLAVVRSLTSALDRD